VKPLVEVLTTTTAWFKERGIPSARLDAELLLGHVLGLDRVKVYLSYERPLTDAELERLRPLVRRRGNREPLAWILGEKEFFGHTFVVTPGVLVPRPDTETIVEAALEWLSEGASSGDRGGGAPPVTPPPTAKASLPWSAEVAAEALPKDDADAAPSEIAQTTESGGVEPVRKSPVPPEAPRDAENRVPGPGPVPPKGAPPDHPGRTASQGAPAGSGVLSRLPSEGVPHRLVGGGGALPPQADTEPPIYVADIGSGSGCIGLTLALERPAVRVFAVDRSEEALAATRANVAKHGLEKRVAVLRGDLLAGIPASRTVDWIVSNPPYIPTRDLDGLQPEVRDHEPRGALDGGADGLDVYRILVPAAAARARKGVLVEVGAGQAPAVAALMAAAGLTDVRTWKDLAGIERVVGGRRPA